MSNKDDPKNRDPEKYNKGGISGMLKNWDRIGKLRATLKNLRNKNVKDSP